MLDTDGKVSIKWYDKWNLAQLTNKGCIINAVGGKDPLMLLFFAER